MLASNSLPIIDAWAQPARREAFEKLPEITGTLLGIKGQYLVWKDGRVFNVRNHTGYHAEIE
jgi:hypothetical protein